MRCEPDASNAFQRPSNAFQRRKLAVGSFGGVGTRKTAECCGVAGRSNTISNAFQHLPFHPPYPLQAGRLRAPWVAQPSLCRPFANSARDAMDKNWRFDCGAPRGRQMAGIKKPIFESSERREDGSGMSEPPAEDGRLWSPLAGLSLGKCCGVTENVAPAARESRT
jgi:hypothetical protein